VFELAGARKDTEKFNLSEGRFEQGVVSGHGLVIAVVVTGDASEIGDLKHARLLVVLDEVGLI
jgi:hypothetical protein